VVSAPDWKLSGLGSIPAPPSHTTAGKSSVLENTALGRAAGGHRTGSFRRRRYGRGILYYVIMLVKYIMFIKKNIYKYFFLLYKN